MRGKSIWKRENNKESGINKRKKTWKIRREENKKDQNGTRGVEIYKYRYVYKYRLRKKVNK